MREFQIGKNDGGQRLDRYLAKVVPLMPPSLSQKYIRLKRIKLNGKRVKQDMRLTEGDMVQLYISDEFFDVPAPQDAPFRVLHPRLNIVYEDENIILADKPPGLVVHPDEHEKVNTLITHMQAYLYQKGEWDPGAEASFAPALCNRIDRNTGGIVIAAKNAAALRILNEKIQQREIAKHYLCLIHGAIRPPAGKLDHFIQKDEQRKQVAVGSRPISGGKRAVTLYKTLATKGTVSLVECELVTGRTHQIRAQMAAAGHPLLGDGKYGRELQNKPYGLRHQALYAYKVTFDFRTPGGMLAYLTGQTFQVQQVDFVTWFQTKEAFPAPQIP